MCDSMTDGGGGGGVPGSAEAQPLSGPTSTQKHKRGHGNFPPVRSGSVSHFPPASVSRGADLGLPESPPPVIPREPGKYASVRLQQREEVCRL